MSGLNGMLMQRYRGQRGSILLLTLLFLLLINLFAVAFWQIVPVELHAAKRAMLETEAYFVSDAGVVDSLAYLEAITADGNPETIFQRDGINIDGNLVLRREGELNSWTWQCDIIPGPETAGNRDGLEPNPLRVYRLEAVARRKGLMGTTEQYRQVSAWVRQRSFVDRNWNILQTGNQELWIFLDRFKLDGDYHTNGPGVLQINNASFWNNTEAAFGGSFTFSERSYDPDVGLADGVKYSGWGNAGLLPYWRTGSDAGQPRDDRYSKISKLGRAGVAYKERDEMPLSSDNVSHGVWGAEPPAILTSDNFVFNTDVGSAGSSVNIAMTKMASDGAVARLEPGDAARNGIWVEGDVVQIEYEMVGINGNTTANAANARDNIGSPTSVGQPIVDAKDDNQLIRIYQEENANRYIEIIHVRDQEYQIPNSDTILGDAPASSLLSPTANDDKGYTVVRNIRNRSNPSLTETIVFADQTNGTIFVNGDVEGVRGVIKGQRTLAVPTSTETETSAYNPSLRNRQYREDHEIHINGEILYAGVRPGDHPSAHVEGETGTIFGMIGYAVRMVGQPANGRPSLASPRFKNVWPTRQDTNQAQPHHLYGSIFAGRRNDPATGLDNRTSNGTTLYGGGFGSIGPDNATWGLGAMVLYGSITEGIRQWKGTDNTGGNNYSFFWDENLATVQPPFFPALPTYDVLTWEEQTVFSF